VKFAIDRLGGQVADYEGVWEKSVALDDTDGLLHDWWWLLSGALFGRGCNYFPTLIWQFRQLEGVCRLKLGHLIGRN
jgi:hypothetical protein